MKHKITAVFFLLSLITWLINRESMRNRRQEHILTYERDHHTNSTNTISLTKKFTMIPKAQPCKYILFANGGKCGSTALFMYLERAYRNYIWDLKGKEHCYRKPPPQVCTNVKPYIMDGCPNGWAHRRAGFSSVKNRTTILLLVRSQADLIQSLINDKGSSGHVQDVEKFAATHMRDVSNNFTLTYKKSTEIFNTVNVIHHDELLSLAGIRSVFARIFPNLPVANISRPIHPNRFSQRDPRHRQLTLSLDMRWKIEDYYEKSNCDFFRKTGVYISGDHCEL